MVLPSHRSLPLVLMTLLLAFSGAARADELAPPPPGFDPARHMRVSEVREGMTGYGVSVFKGDKLQRFNVKVLSVLHNFNPKTDVVLIECSGANLEHTGSIAGMSGSPVYLHDEQGRDRLIGAFAYGWPMMKDPVAGVQPIEYMLAIPTHDPATQPASEAQKVTRGLNSGAKPHVHWSLTDAVPLLSRPAAVEGRNGSGGVPRLQALATPLMASGFSPRVLQQVNGMLRASSNLVALEAGGIGGSNGEGPTPKLEPGAVLAVPLMLGDSEMTAIGTVTDVVHDASGHDRVIGFGHPFNNEGAIALPMGSGRINAVIANLTTSFKIGALSREEGTLLSDDTVGVAGRMGKAPAMIPVDIKVVYADGSESHDYHFRIAQHPKLTPMLAAAAFISAAGGAHDPPQFYTADYDLKMDFSNGRSVTVANTDVDTAVPDLFNEIGIPIALAAENPFERVGLKALSGTLTISGEAREAHIVSVTLPRTKYQPGETAKLFLTYRPFRGGEATMPIEFDLPRELPDGTYQLVVTDWQAYLEGEKQVRPFRFTADSGPELFAAMKDLMGVRHDAVYVQLMRKPDGVAIGRTAMPHLPSSRREVLLSAGQSDTTAFVSSTLKIVPTGMVMDGSANFAITIDREAKLDTSPASPKAPKHVSPVPGKGEQPGKPPAAKADVPAGADTQPSK